METLCHGVRRPNNIGISHEVIQNNVPDPRMVDKRPGQMKAAVLIDDDTCQNLLAAFVYDQKPVTILSSISESITWKVSTRKIYSHLASKDVDMQYLQLKIIDNYNNNVNSIDLADQMCTSCYCCDHLFRNYKLWSIFLWAIGMASSLPVLVWRRESKEGS